MTTLEIAFLHIPKTAGTSQHQSFNRHYGKDAVFWFGEDSPPAIRRFPEDQLGAHWVFGGHKPISFYPPELDPLYCAVLRDPVERAISLYAYYTRPELASGSGERAAREKVGKYMRKHGIDPDSMLRTLEHSKKFRDEVSNTHCRYLSRGAATFEGVKETLATADAVIGTVAEYDRFHSELARILGWSETRPASANRSRAPYASHYLDDPAIVERLRELNREDELLLQYVKNDHGGLLVNLGDSSARVARLQALPQQPEQLTRPVQITMQEARSSEVWPSGRDNELPWPEKHVIALAQKEALYMPIHGTANAIVVSVLASQLPIPRRELIPARALQNWLANFNMGVMLKDFPIGEAQALLQDRQVPACAIIRDPVARLLDVYLDIIVHKPGQLLYQKLFRDSLAAVQGCEHPDVHLGMTFRQFVDNICSTPAPRLGLARAPQASFLAPLLPDCRLYVSEQLTELLIDAGVPAETVAGSRDELSAAAEADIPVVAVGDLADVMPAELRNMADLEPGRLIDAELEKRLRVYYADDDALFTRARALVQPSQARQHRGI